MAGEVIYIFYSYLFGLYGVSLTAMIYEHDRKCYRKDSFILFYFV